MRQYIISEEQLKDFLRTINELSFANDPRFYMPSDEDLEPTEDDLKGFTEIKEHEYIPDIDKEFSNLLKKMINKLKKEL